MQHVINLSTIYILYKKIFEGRLKMGILEGAAMIREIAIKIAKEKGITEQKEWPEAVKEFKEKYELVL
ncbi:TPA: hypothetical protein KOP98_002407 [Clostridioides difficile]|nr:hypothetical protein [Clostridioides difficile]HBF0259986.1 hypothetical protein [Clostridioides difficile]HBF5195728.1 hypothetical protein [Clostridioides difficile]HBF6652101.1 hypothetical protein [Clostridioides difficile]HBF9295587.1 hypothetical protein [Clostridioides difficile]